jgi:hypothetical protein
MRAARYRLRFVPGVSVSAATYGSSTFGGDITYGQLATDSPVAFRYRVIPLPGGYLAQPAWIYRHGDVMPPLRLQIAGDDGPLDLTAVTSTAYGGGEYGDGTYGGGWAQLILTAVDEREILPYILALDVSGPSAQGVLVHNWDPVTDPDVSVGLYRVLVMLRFESGRRFVLPSDDNLQLVMT